MSERASYYLCNYLYTVYKSDSISFDAVATIGTIVTAPPFPALEPPKEEDILLILVGRSKMSLMLR